MFLRNCHGGSEEGLEILREALPEDPFLKIFGSSLLGKFDFEEFGLMSDHRMVAVIWVGASWDFFRLSRLLFLKSSNVLNLLAELPLVIPSVAAALLSPARTSPWSELLYLAVQSDERNRGLGSELVRVAIEQKFITEGTLVNTLAKGSTVSFYESLGFRVEQRILGRVRLRFYGG